MEICGTEYHTWGIITQYGLFKSWEMEKGSLLGCLDYTLLFYLSHTSTS